MTASLSSQLRLDLMAALDIAIATQDRKLAFGPPHDAMQKVLADKRRFERAKKDLACTRLLPSPPLPEDEG